MDIGAEIKLQYPVGEGDSLTESVTIVRRPQAESIFDFPFAALSLLEAQDFYPMIANIINKSVSFIEEMAYEDISRLEEYTKDALGEGMQGLAEDSEKMEFPHTYDLKHPVKLGSSDLTSVTFTRPPNGRMMKRFPISMGAQRLRHYLPIISGMAGVESLILHKADAEDFLKMVGLCIPFLNSGQGDGKSTTD